MDDFEDQQFHDSIGKVCIKQYELLPSKGKPINGEEWTHVAGVVVRNSQSRQLNVVALGTGSKCIGEKALDHNGRVYVFVNGWRVNDSHAEVLARRSFRRYLLNQIKLAIMGKESLVLQCNEDSKLFRFKDGITFHFFCSHTPCGDASIFPNSKYVVIQETKETKLKQNFKRKQDDQTNQTKDNHNIIESSAKRVKVLIDESISDSAIMVDSVTVPDVHRTGAKCVAGDTLDPKLPGDGYHVTGVLRTKPGRGDPTRSMSCSDKLMKWNFVGCQGSLLGHYLSDPVYFSTVTISGKEYDINAITRALITRSIGLKNRDERFVISKPIIKHVDVTCEGLSEDGRKLSHKASTWCVCPKSYEVLILGLKQGCNTKSLPNELSSVSVCKQRFLHEFIDLVETTPTDIVPSTLTDIHLRQSSYWTIKQANRKYQIAKTDFLKQFPTWSRNDPVYEEFKYNDKII